MEVVNPIRDGVYIGSGGSGLCGGWMNISSTPLWFWEYWGIYRAKRRSGGHLRRAQPTREVVSGNKTRSNLQDNKS